MSSNVKWCHANGNPFQNIRPNEMITPTMEMIFRTPEYFHNTGGYCPTGGGGTSTGGGGGLSIDGGGGTSTGGGGGLSIDGGGGGTSTGGGGTSTGGGGTSTGGCPGLPTCAAYCLNSSGCLTLAISFSLKVLKKTWACFTGTVIVALPSVPKRNLTGTFFNCVIRLSRAF